MISENTQSSNTKHEPDRKAVSASIANILGWEQSEVLQYLETLPNECFTRYEAHEIIEQITQLTALTYAEPINFTHDKDYKVFRFYTFNKPGLFSFLSGVLGAMDFHILSGVLYTPTLRRAWSSHVVICELSGRIENDVDHESWVWQLQQQIGYIFRNFARTKSQPEDVVNEVVRLVAGKLQNTVNSADRLYPITIEMDNTESETKLDVYSEDTLFFLYLFSHVLYLHKLDIVGMNIYTYKNKIHDTIWFIDTKEDRIHDEDFLNRIKLLVLVTKQLSHSLPHTPDPFRTLSRFGKFIQEFTDKRVEQILDILLDKPGTGHNLALLLGSSDFLWEDFIRIQHENIIPFLSMVYKQELRSLPEEDVGKTLASLIAAEETFEGKRQALNTFKDKESYLIDIDHILNENLGFFFLSKRLSILSEEVVRAALSMAEEVISAEYGVPQSISGLTTTWAAFGLGKLGGRALGYASDIEILFVYGDDGRTSGTKQISNRDYFNRLFQLAISCIDAKREGIFHIDTRLRPYGEDGPLAVHIKQFVSYYGPNGKAHSIEKLALIRLRWVAGDQEFGKHIISIRDQLLYQTQGNIVIEDIREARKRQLQEKVVGKKRNAKFSPGALVDLEYNVQILQIRHGANEPRLREPAIMPVLRNLGEAGVVDPEELEHVIKANAFFRTLINGLRMLRGNAQDLFLSPYMSKEFTYLAQRLHYNKSTQGARQLQIDFEMHTARVRSFVEHYLGKDALPLQNSGTIVDVILKGDFTVNDFTSRVLSECSIKDTKRALENIKNLAGSGEVRLLFISLIVMVWDVLQKCIDPDMALNNWERYTSMVADKEVYYRQLLAQTRKAEVLLTVCAGSVYLSDLLIKYPEFLTWLSRPGQLTRSRNFEDMQRSIKGLFREQADSEPEQLLNHARQREMLRIATKDICLDVGLEEITTELSILAQAVLSCALDLARDEQEAGVLPSLSSICVLAFGKLGGMELNYSSDIDLLCIYSFPEQEQRAEVERRCQKVFQRLIALAGRYASLRGYRIDLRLGPYGSSDKVVHSYASCIEYYQEKADLWELQAALKLSPMVGNTDLGEKLIKDIQDCMYKRLADVVPAVIAENVKSNREKAVSMHAAAGIDVKNGVGGIRDIEFLVQCLQLIHCRDYPILTGNTLHALTLLRKHNLVRLRDVDMLRNAYVFLRKVEHALQIQEDRQLHVVHERIILSHLVTTNESFEAKLKKTLSAVRNCYLQYLSVYENTE